MTYFKAKFDAYDHTCDHGVIEGELLTAKERANRVPKLPNYVFDTVVIPKSKTFTSFGVRKEVNHEWR